MTAAVSLILMYGQGPLIVGDRWIVYWGRR
jgi:hypothetical protein